MEKRDRWVVKNKILATFLLNVLLCSVFSVFFALLEFSVWFIIVFDLFIILINGVYPSVCSDNLLKKAIKSWEEYCDPEPLLNETEFLLGCRNSAMVKQILFMNKSAALSSIGKTREAYDMLISMNIDKEAYIPDAARLLYYNNLMVYAHNLGMNELADITYSKLLLMYPDIKNKKTKEDFDEHMKESKASFHIRKGEYEQAIDALNQLSPQKMRSKVENAFTYAKVYLALGETEKAKDHLVFVIVNGNKLACVNEARELLKTTPYADILKLFSIN